MVTPPTGGPRLALDGLHAPEPAEPGEGARPGQPPSQFLRDLQRAFNSDIDRLFGTTDAQRRELIGDTLLGRHQMRRLSEVGTEQQLDDLRATLRGRSALNGIRAEAAARLLDPLIAESREAPEVAHDAALAAIKQGLALAFPQAGAAELGARVYSIIEKACWDPAFGVLYQDGGFRIDTLDRLQRARQVLRESVATELSRREVETTIMAAFPELRGQRALVIDRVLARVEGVDGQRPEPANLTDGQFDALVQLLAEDRGDIEREVQQELDEATARLLAAQADGSWDDLLESLGDEVARRLPAIDRTELRNAMDVSYNNLENPTMEAFALAVLAGRRRYAPYAPPPDLEDRPS